MSFGLRNINLAPWKYRHVHRNHGGPIKRISARKNDFLSMELFDAFAWLDDALVPNDFREPLALYGDAHGSGTASSQALAVYKAVSEALERWAWFACAQNDLLRESLRFDIDASTNGFAAYPGFGVAGARTRAFCEAVERWTLCAWWRGELQHSILPLESLSRGAMKRVLSSSGIENILLLHTPFDGVYVVLLWGDREDIFSRAYGFAASFDLSEALSRACSELMRNRKALDYFLSNPPLSQEIISETEKRLVYFSSAEGASRFEGRLVRSPNVDVSIHKMPTLFVDKKVDGLWSKYTDVWRCLFDMREFSAEGEEFFLF